MRKHRWCVHSRPCAAETLVGDLSGSVRELQRLRGVGFSDASESPESQNEESRAVSRRGFR